MTYLTEITPNLTDYSFFQKEIEEHRQTLNPEAPRDFLDAFLIEMSSAEEDFTGKFPAGLHSLP